MTALIIIFVLLTTIIVYSCAVMAGWEDRKEEERKGKDGKE